MMDKETNEYNPDTGLWTEPDDSDDGDEILKVAASSLIPFATTIKENYNPGKHHFQIAKELMRVATGKTKRLIIMAPPQHGKSELATQLFPAFYMGHFPEQSIIVGGYAQDKADDFGRKTKAYMGTELYKAIFPHTRISSASDSIRRFQTTKGGEYYAVGIGGPATGRGANGLLLDDPYKNREEADSETRTGVITDWWTSSFRSRLRGDGWIIVIQTRWNKRDLIQFLLDQEKANETEGKYKWRIVKLKAVIEDEDDAKSDPLKRKIGECLWPEVFPPDVMAQMKKDVGTRDWNALYQQEPSDAKGEIFLRSWWRYYCRSSCGADHVHYYKPNKVDKRMGMWDCTFKDADSSDYVVGLLGEKCGPDLFLVDRFKKKTNIQGTCEGIVNMMNKYPDIKQHGVEDKANGPAVVSTMKQIVSGVKEIKAKGTKEGRWNAAAPSVESGHVFYPYGAPWVDDFIEVCAAVPHGKHDDDADAVSYLILEMLGSALDGMLQWMREQVANRKNVN
jgi:predicted phage terminase large subunit-like protein